MKKLISMLGIFLLAAQPHHTRTMDEWTLVCGSLAVVSGALILSACANYHQHSRIQELENTVATKNTLITTLTQERDARPESLWKGFLEKLSSFSPFLCIKEEVITADQKKLLKEFGFSQSQRHHKIAGLVTLISSNPHFTDKEKNLVSDEEDALDERDRLLEDIGSDLEELDLKLERIRQGETDELE